MTEYNKTNPFPAKILKRTLLSGPQSTKKTYHLTLNLKGSNILFSPGDSVGIYPENPHDLVEGILKALGDSGQEEIVEPRSQATLTFHQFLKIKANLMRITLPLLKQFPQLKELVEDKEKRKAFIESHDLLDLFETHGSPQCSLQELASYLSPLLPRFYSIASSQKVQPDQVDLLVATFSYHQGGKMRSGLGSQFLCEHAQIEETPIPTYPHPSVHFKLPENGKAPIIMIGPGTGVAPYRAFLQERIYEKASGKNWLFFGEREQRKDFYYEDYLLQCEKEGQLRLDCAFSRDQKEKVYVQHLLKKHETDVWEWIQEGAFIYICGDARHMAKDVTATLHMIAEEKGGLSDDEAKDFIRTLRKEKRLLLDVY